MGRGLKYSNIRGQAVVEGVMLRASKHTAVAVRLSPEKIVIRSLFERRKRFRWANRPLLRGAQVFVREILSWAENFGFSLQVLSDVETDSERHEFSVLTIVMSIVLAFLVGMGVFVALPHLVTSYFASTEILNLREESVEYHLIDGLFKVIILTIYVALIGFIPDVKRLLQYHGAEHKAVRAFEKNGALDIESAREERLADPRCPTTFLYFVIVLSIPIFSVLFGWLNIESLSSNAVIHHLLLVSIKILLLLPIAGIAYEWVKFCAFRLDSGFFKLLFLPLYFLQAFITKEPGDDQLEVAVVALRHVLRLEKGISHQAQSDEPGSESLIEVASLAEIGRVDAQPKDYLE